MIGHLQSNKVRFLGAIHGFAGNAQALLAGLEWFSETEQAQILARITDTLKRTAKAQDTSAAMDL